MSERRPKSDQPRQFTGRHMAWTMIAFFGVIIAVNLVMARFAISSFGGTVVDNSYVASQKYNGWLQDAREQEKLGWSENFSADDNGQIEIAVTTGEGPLEGVTINAIARHPVGHAEDIELIFSSVGEGKYRADSILPDGRWTLNVSIKKGDDEKRLIKDWR